MASLKLKLFGRVRINKALDRAAVISVQRHNEQEQAFRGYDESATSLNKTRYVNDKGVICERFLGFFDVSAERNAEAITVVMETIDKYNPAAKLICQTYDGASCMSGQRGGVQALMKTHCQYALWSCKKTAMLTEAVPLVGTSKVEQCMLCTKARDHWILFLIGSLLSPAGIKIKLPRAVL
ncbi:unnamed protein product [Coregonus sp. 'balchen']|nr:unnamed protein product [Coregonus sp. 'balchen']